jgi:hypothetical protein
MNGTLADVGNEILVPTDLPPLPFPHLSLSVDLHRVQPQTHKKYFDVLTQLMKNQQHFYCPVQGVPQMFGVNRFRTLFVLATGQMSIISLPDKSGSFTSAISIIPAM